MRRIYIKEHVCIGCHLCEIYCQLKHSLSKDLIKTFKRESPPPLPRLQVEAQGTVSFSVNCQQCSEPTCVYACLTGALTHDVAQGIVKLDEEKCVGCWTCILACPFAAIKQDMSHRKTVRCDLCQDETIPACVANCPNEALVCIEEQK